MGGRGARDVFSLKRLSVRVLYNFSMAVSLPMVSSCIGLPMVSFCICLPIVSLRIGLPIVLSLPHTFEL